MSECEVSGCEEREREETKILDTIARIFEAAQLL